VKGRRTSRPTAANAPPASRKDARRSIRAELPAEPAADSAFLGMPETGRELGAERRRQPIAAELRAEILRLRLEGVPTRHVAAFAGVSPSTVNSILRRYMRELRSPGEAATGAAPTKRTAADGRRKRAKT
jgi:DNA-directed RNA polymerase specialized sigma24 family protein